jgi:hypothetical protein
MTSKISLKVIEKSTNFTLIILFFYSTKQKFTTYYFFLLNNYFIFVSHTPIRPNVPHKPMTPTKSNARNARPCGCTGKFLVRKIKIKDISVIWCLFQASSKKQKRSLSEFHCLIIIIILKKKLQISF